MINWEILGLCVVSILLFTAGDYIRRLTKESKELLEAVSDALEDDEITKEELALIFKEAVDVKQVVFEIARLLAGSFRR